MNYVVLEMQKITIYIGKVNKISILHTAVKLRLQPMKSKI